MANTYAPNWPTHSVPKTFIDVQSMLDAFFTGFVCVSSDHSCPPFAWLSVSPLSHVIMLPSSKYVATPLMQRG